MGSYYQDKRNYNKYNPTSSFSDRNRYGNNNNKVDDYSDFNRIPERFNRPTSYSAKKKQSIVTSEDKVGEVITFCLCATIFLMILPMIIFRDYDTMTLGSMSWSLCGYVLMISTLESAVLIFGAWILIIKDHYYEIMYSKQNVLFFLLLFAIPVLIIATNVSIVKYLNVKLDKNKPVKRYLQVIEKTFKVRTSSGKNKTTTTYYEIHLTSWRKGPFIFHCTKSEYFNYYGRGDIMILYTNTGYFNMDYYYGLKRLDNNPFPKDTEFPLTEDEAQVLFEKKQKEDTEKKSNPYGHNFKYK